MGISRQEIVVSGTLLFALLWTTPHAETLVYPRLLESRTDDVDFLLHVRAGLTLNLRKSSILAKDFVITSSTDAGTDNVVLNGSELEQDLYHNTEHRSSLLVKRKQNGVEVRGILNDQLRITPAFLAQRSDEGLIPHEVFTVEERSSTSRNLTEHSKNEKCVTENTTSAGKSKSNCIDEFVVELCMAAGPSYWRAFNETEDLVTYIATAMNAVALWFIELEDPAIRLQLNRIIKHECDSIAGRSVCGQTLYELRKHNTCAAEILDALHATVGLANQCDLKDCDLVLQLTRGDLAMEVNRTHINRKVQGVTNFGGVCTNHSAAVAEDEPRTFSGVSTMAHEIAHALGASHDGENQTLPIDGYPHALNCSWQDGYLMSSSGEGKNMQRLSNCTQAQIKFLVETLPDSCIQVDTKANYSNDYYPAQNMTPETFCRKKHPQHEGVQAYNLSDTDYQECKIDCCWKLSFDNIQARDVISVEDSDYYDSSYEYTGLRECQRHHMLEAMSCGENKTCWRGVCGEHNWTEIYNKYHTERAFKTR
ncbi:venom metalloproteinase antarease-like TtrivMP_A isoform X2 [Rhipicephalus sanguineus]|uniref:venom metalloproteinase antarease-like TtrivMP_A isoform X2 n=1 Tax=Rhipicephalus sanguineus TaxID=34632 RepID=UPI0020C2DDF4|nr:venom metalloproteinase antarease-like TtrivMP_A isoform X2 [Rhipicephalus sanguineus]